VVCLWKTKPAHPPATNPKLKSESRRTSCE
jgi:hypothetical protein